MLVDMRLLIFGLVLLAIGISLLAYTNTTVPTGNLEMTEEEIFELFLKEQEHKDTNTIASLFAGIGFILVLISFGARRKRKSGSNIKRVEKKPDVGM